METCYGHFVQPEYPIAFPTAADRSRRRESIAWNRACSTGDPYGYNRAHVASFGFCYILPAKCRS